MTIIFRHEGENYSAYKRAGMIFVGVIGRGYTYLLEDINLPKEIKDYIEENLSDDTDT